MRAVYSVIFIIVIGAIAAISKLSPSVIINLTIPNTPNVFQMTLEFYTGFIILLTGVVSVFYFKYQFAQKNIEANSYKRKCEKATIEHEDSVAKVAALEAKIATLDDALKKTLDNNS